MREGNQPMSYTRVREILLDSLKPILLLVMFQNIVFTVSVQVEYLKQQKRVCQIGYLRVIVTTSGTEMRVRDSSATRIFF